MRFRRFATLAAVTFGFALLAAWPARAGEGARTLARTEDAIVVEGGQLPAALGWEIGQTRLFAFRNGRAEAIPFQIDQRDDKGEYYLPFGPGKRDGDGLVKKRDQLVFMAADAGDRGERDGLPPGFDRALELAVADSLDGGRAWVCLVHYPNVAPPLSTAVYARYDNATTTIDTTRYAMSFHQKAKIAIGRLLLKPAGGGSNQNLVDRLKIRFTATIVGVGMKVGCNEEDFISRTVGWINGPVRVVRHTVNQVQLWKLKTPKAYMDNVYYANAFEFPTVVEMPFRSDLLISEAHFRVSSDGLCKALPRMFYNSNNRQGVKIDGVWTEEKAQLDKRPYTWSVVTDSPETKGAWMNRLIYDATATPVRPYLYFNDNRDAHDDPEDEPGECGDVGYTLENVGQLKKDKLYLKSIMYNIPDFQLDRVQQYMNILDKPLTVTAAEI
jgi:hypothetical protein